MGGELEPGDRSRLEILLEIRERLIGLEAHAADQSEEISSLFDLLARNGRTDSASPRPPPETGLGKRLAEADREILARIDSFGEGVRALGVALPELESLARIAGRPHEP